VDLPMTSPPLPRVLSGIQPTGELHIGNWLGAVRTWVAQVAEQKEELLFCIVDAHAITVEYDPVALRERTMTMARDLIACGLDTSRCTLFVQSDVREHTELAWYLANVTPFGDLSRMTQFKDKVEKDGISAAAPRDGQQQGEHVLSGYFMYPVLMSADILLYKATVVPVGDDQLQHLELARETARRFNYRFGELFPEPKARMSVAPRIMGLDGLTKMSKSKGNTIGLFEDREPFWNKLKGAYTDPQRLRRSDPGRPEICNIYTMHKALSTPEQVDLTYKECTTAQRGCIDCKKILMEGFERELVPLRAKRAELDAHPERTREALGEGAAKARRIAAETIREVRGRMGLGTDGGSPESA
jgi:tryptophanyl-tRNA synthetase